MTAHPDRLAPAGWMTSAKTRAVMDALGADQDKARFVGGCVRNALRGAAVDDIDVATVHEPAKVIELVEAAGLKAVPTGIDHGTITVVSQSTPYEVTTLRRDVETDGRYAKVAFTTDWAEDAGRRDFTMNAIYADMDGTLHDPVGGIPDALSGTVRFVGDPRRRIREDYLRILRLFRFHAWYGGSEIGRETLAAVAELREGLRGLSVERIRNELLKLLSADDPLPALRAMAVASVLNEVLPEAEKFERLGRLAAIESGQLFTSDAVLRLGALLGNGAHAAAVGERLKLSKDDRERLVRMHDDQLEIVSYLSAREVRRALYWFGVRTFQDRAMLAWAADPKDSTAAQWRALIAMAQSWQRPTLPLTGAEVMAAGVPKGPEVGRVMADVERWWVDTDFTDDRFSVIERLKAIVQATVY